MKNLESELMRPGFYYALELKCIENWQYFGLSGVENFRCYIEGSL